MSKYCCSIFLAFMQYVIKEEQPNICVRVLGVQCIKTFFFFFFKLSCYVSLTDDVCLNRYRVTWVSRSHCKCIYA